VEIYERAFATTIDEHFRSVLARSRPITLEEIDARPLPVKGAR